MSTKCTLAAGPNFHFYSDALDDDHIYLELERCRFEASDRHVIVEIPVAMWEVIRKRSIVDLSLADKSDAEIKAHVEAEVQKRIEKYAEADDRGKSLFNLHGSIVYGAADTPREEQIANGLKYFLQRRAKQVQLRKDIEDLEESGNRTCASS